MLTDRLPPHDLNAEQAVIGALLIDGSRFGDVAGIIKPTDFYRESWAWCFEAMETIWQHGGKIDQLVVADRICSRVSDEQERGDLRAALSMAVSLTPTSENAVHYAEIVRRLSDLRSVINTAQSLAEDAYNQGANPADLGNRMIEDALALRRNGPHNLRSIRQHADDSFNKLVEIFEDGHEAKGVPTGIPKLDRMLGGLQRGKLIVVGGRTSMGKTQVLAQLAMNVAAKGERVIFYSLEEPSIDLIARMISNRMGVDWQRLPPEERAKRRAVFQEALGYISDLPIHTSDAARLSTGEMNAHAAVIRSQHKDLSLICVDYLNLADEPKTWRESRVEVVDQITVNLKRVARELDVCVVAAAQLNRDPEHRASREPTLTDLRESGGVEMHADAVILLYRPWYYVERGMASADEVRPRGWNGTEPDLMRLLRANIAKQRSGPVGPVNLYYDPPTGRIRGWAE